MNLDSKTAIVTGASSGLGKAFCEALIKKGANVYGLARSKDKLEKIHQKFGNHFHGIALDITEHNAIEQWIDDTFSHQNSPDVLINNAGLGLFGDVDELTLEDWHTMIDTNVSGVFYMCRQIIPRMKNSEEICHIVNIASIAGKIGTPKMSGYNATKFGVSGFSESLFKEVRYDGIKVSCLFPGSVATHFFDNAEGVETHSNMMQPRNVADQLIHVLETPDNMLVNEVVMRPLNPKEPNEQ